MWQKQRRLLLTSREPNTDHQWSAVEKVNSTTFLAVHIIAGPFLDKQHCITGQESPARALASIMSCFHWATFESILTSYITVWYGSCTASNHKTLQHMVNKAGKIFSVGLSSLLGIYYTHLTCKTISTVSDSTNPSYNLPGLLPPGRRYQSLCASSTSKSKSFIHQAVEMVNSLPSVPLLLSGKLPSSQMQRLLQLPLTVLVFVSMLVIKSVQPIWSMTKRPFWTLLDMSSCNIYGTTR